MIDPFSIPPTKKENNDSNNDNNNIVKIMIAIQNFFLKTEKMRFSYFCKLLQEKGTMKVHKKLENVHAFLFIYGS